MADHPVLRSDAPLGDVPTAPKHLEGLDMQEPVRRKSNHQLLNLNGRGEVRAQDRSRFEGAAERLERPPWFRQVENTSVEPLTRSADIGDITHAQIELLAGRISAINQCTY